VPTTSRMLKTPLVCHSGDSRSDRDEECRQFARVAGTLLLSSDPRLGRNSVIGRSPRTEGVWACARIDILSDLRFAPLPIFSRLPRSPRRLEAVASIAASSSQPAVACGAATAHHGSLCCSIGEEGGSLGAALKSKPGGMDLVLFALRPACANASARRQKALGRRAEGRPGACGLPAV
jgi:hypothetical protein